MALFGRENEQDKARAEALAAWVSRQNAYAIASAVLGIVSLIEFGVLFLWVGGIGCGFIALRQLRSPDLATQRNSGQRLAWLGIVTSAISLILAMMLYLHR